MFIQCSDLVFNTAQGMTSQIGHGDIKIGKKNCQGMFKECDTEIRKTGQSFGVS